MRKLLLLLTFLAFLLQGHAESPTDSLVEELGKEIKVIKKNVSEIQKSVDTLKASVNVLRGTGKDREIIFIEWVLIFSPAWIFVLALVIIKKKLKGFSLKDALTGEELPKKNIPNPEYTTSNLNALAANTTVAGVLTTLIPPTIEVTAGTEYPESSSRYIALITSALTWIIVLCLSCFYLYQYIRTGESPDFSRLSTVMLTLGIGVVPYAFNKVSTAIGK